MRNDDTIAAAPRARRRLLALAGLLGLAILACADGTWAQPATFTPREETPEEFPPGPGRDETFYTCTACHNFKLVAAQGMNRRQWDDSLNWMTEKHNMPALADNDRKIVLDYLEANFPPRAPARPGGWQSPFAPR